MNSKTLLVIDIQNDYFSGGAFPLYNTEETLNNIVDTIEQAKAQQVSIVLVQHIDYTSEAGSSFLCEGTEGAKIHPKILDAAKGAPIVIKTFADSFEQTTLSDTLAELGAEELIICGMMTQNCVAHTAISRDADKYKVSVLPECCTTTDKMIHNIGLRSITSKIPFKDIESAFS